MAMLGYCTVGSNRLAEAKAFYGRAGLDWLGLLRCANIHPAAGSMAKMGVPASWYSARSTANRRLLAMAPCAGFSSIRKRRSTPFMPRRLLLVAWMRAPQGFELQKFYMSYFRDLDGNKLCAYCTT